MIRLYLFGTFRLLVNDLLVDRFRSDKARALLAYLALSDNQPLLRSTLATLFWDGYQIDSAFANLRTTLSNLRQVLLPFELLQTTRKHVQLDRASPQFWCDALAPDWFSYPADRQEFLPGAELIDSAPFQRWLQERRASYQQMRAAHQLSCESATAAAGPSVPNNLPRLLTPLIGRDKDLGDLAALVHNDEHALITLVGEGGVGKTRLALAVAQASVKLGSQPPSGSAAGSPGTAHFTDGVWFVPLAGIGGQEDLPTHLATAIGEALRFKFSGPDLPTVQLYRHLQHKRTLLILDNFEQLTAGAIWLVTLLQKTTALKLLVTSRQRLNLEAEYVFRLAGLVIPAETEISTVAEAAFLMYSSIQLFVHRAERTLHNFHLSSENFADIARICRFVHGLPLGIVLATTLLEQYNCAQIVAKLQENYAILAATLADLPPRQRSIHAVLDGSWQLLQPTERAILAQCAVFSGSFSTAAAHTVAKATPANLARLEAVALLRSPGLARYEMHELVRQHALAQLRLQPLLEQQAQAAHCTYYLNLVQQQGEELYRNVQAQHLMHEELENIRAAWTWAVNQGEVALLTSALPALMHFYGLAGLQQEAATVLSQTMSQLRPTLTTATPNAAAQRLYTALLLEQAYFQLNLAQPEQATALVEEARSFLPALADAQLEINAHLRAGDIAWAQGDYQRHRAAYTQSLLHAQAQGWQQLIAHSLTNLGMNHDVCGEYSAAIDKYQAALQVAQQLDHRQQMNIIYNNLGVSYELLGDFSAALHYYRQTLQASHALADQEGVGVAHLNLGITLSTLGAWPEAQDHLEQALTLFRLEGHQRLEAKARVQLALILGSIGEEQQALDYAQQAHRLAQHGDFRGIEAGACQAMGQILCQQGNYPAAAQMYQLALEQWQKLGQLRHVVSAQSGLALSRFHTGELVLAQQLVEDLVSLLALHPHLPKSSLFYLACYQILADQHDGRAAEMLLSGYQLLQNQADTISDPVLRTKFLTNVRANWALVQLVNKQSPGASDLATAPP